MTKHRRVYFWIGFTAFFAAILFYIFNTDGPKAAVHSVFVWAIIFFGFLFLQWLARFYPITRKNGWNVLGPDPNALIFIGMPFFIALIVLTQHWVDYYFFSELYHFSYFFLLSVYVEQPLLGIFIFSFVLYGIVSGFVSRLRWNEQSIEYRNMFFETRSVRWGDIDHVELGGPFVSNEAILKNGKRIKFAKFFARAGVDQLEGYARTKGILIAPSNDHTERVRGYDLNKDSNFL